MKVVRLCGWHPCGVRNYGHSVYVTLGLWMVIVGADA